MTVEAIAQPFPSARAVSRQGFARNPIVTFIRTKPLGAFGAAVVLTLVLTAIFADVIAPYDPVRQDVPYRLRSPDESFWFGTDIYGRDVFSRIVYGARISLYVGLLSVVIGTAAGVLVGSSSGYFGGKYDLWMQRVMDALMGFPPIVLALILVVALGPSLNSVTVAIAITYLPRVARLARSSALAIKEEAYVDAARTIGCTAPRIMLQHVIPNSLTPVFVLATGQLGNAIVAEATLSFLGLGVPPPDPSWGGMLQFGAKGYLESAPWLTIFPGLALSSVVFAFALFGDALRDVLDPRLKGR
ncbi:MAG: ABC transporter permease [Chloroflexota bacterium]